MNTNISFFKVDSLNQAVGFINENRTCAKIIAGGTDVIPGIHQASGRFKDISVLIDLTALNELKEAKVIDNNLYIGANLTYSEIQNNEIVKAVIPSLAKSSGLVGSPQIRNRATVVGNIINCAPCADSLPALLIHDARLKIVSVNGEREIKIEDILENPYKTQLKNNEIVTHFIIPIINKPFLSEYYKLGRRKAVNISRLTYSVLAVLEFDKLTDFRIACGAVTPIAKRFYGVEKSVIGKKIDEVLIKSISSQVGQEILNTTGYRWSSDYKIPVAQQVLYQVLTQMFMRHAEIIT